MPSSGGAKVPNEDGIHTDMIYSGQDVKHYFVFWVVAANTGH